MHYLKRKTKSATSFFGVGSSDNNHIDNSDVIMDNDDDFASPSISPTSSSSSPYQSSSSAPVAPPRQTSIATTRTSGQYHDIQPKLDIPNSIKLAIDKYNNENQDQDYDEFGFIGNVTSQGVAYIVLPTELYIWSLDSNKTTVTYDRIDIPYQMRFDQICITRNKKNYDTYTAFYVTDDGSVRYWPQTNRPSQSQEISLDYRGNTNAYIVECDPFGVVIANSQGTIHLVTVGRGNNTLTPKMINKSQGLLGYLYLAKQPPVVALVSIPQLTSALRQVYVLTETSLIKYEINENGERIMFDYSLQRDVQQQFSSLGSGVFKLISLYVDSEYNDEFDTVYILVQHSVDETKKVYLMSLQVKQNQVFNPKKIDRFECIQEKLFEKPKLISMMMKHYVCWTDLIYSFSEYQGSSDSLALNYPIIGCGEYKNELYFIDRPNGVQSLNIPPFSSDLSLNDKLNESNILFEIPEEEDHIGSIRNTILSTLNSFSMKKQNALQQSLEVCNKIDRKSFDLACKRVSQYVTDQKPASRYWAADSDVLHHLGSNLSVQLKQQIDDKRKRHQIFTQFLDEFGFKKELSRETFSLIKSNECHLNAAADLREFQNLQEGGNTLLARLIQDAVSGRLGSNWQNNAMNVYDLFYSNISMIDDLLILIEKELRDLDVNYTDSLIKLKTLLEANSITLKLLSNYNPSMINQKYQPQQSPLQQQQTKSKNEPLYIMVRFQIDTINRFIETDLKTGPANFLLNKLSDTNIAHSENILYDQLKSLILIYLDAIKLNEPKAVGQLSTLLASNFISSGRYSSALEIAQPFGDYHTIVQVYINDKDNSEQQLKMLIKSLKQFLNEGNVNVVYQYMLDCGLRQELLQLPAEFNNSIAEFLQKYPQISWINSIKMKQWNEAAKTLLQESQREDQSLSRKKTLISLSKLSLLAEGKEPLPNIESVIDISNQKLELIKIQKEFLPDQKIPINTQDLINDILNSENYQNLDKYAICLNTLEESNLLIKPEERIQLFKLILLHAFDNGGIVELSLRLVDNTNLTDIQFDMLIIETTFFQLLHHLPTDAETTAIVKSFLQEYHQERQKQISTQSQKLQFTRILNRVLELSKREQ